MKKHFKIIWALSLVHYIKCLANAYKIKMKKTRMRSLAHSLIIPVWSHPVLKLKSISV